MVFLKMGSPNKVPRECGALKDDQDNQRAVLAGIAISSLVVTDLGILATVLYFVLCTTPKEERLQSPNDPKLTPTAGTITKVRSFIAAQPKALVMGATVGAVLVLVCVLAAIAYAVYVSAKSQQVVVQRKKDAVGVDRLGGSNVDWRRHNCLFGHNYGANREALDRP